MSFKMMEKWRLGDVSGLSLHILCVSGCTYAMDLRGVREEEAETSTNGAPGDSKRERETTRGAEENFLPSIIK